MFESCPVRPSRELEVLVLVVVLLLVWLVVAELVRVDDVVVRTVVPQLTSNSGA